MSAAPDLAKVVPLFGSNDPKADGTPTGAQYRSYVRVYDFMNERLFDGQLPNVMLTFSRKPKARGFFKPETWHDRSSGALKLGEIALNPDQLAHLDGRTIASIILHEMVHCWQQAFGKPSRRGYHNKQWAGRMDEVGLMPSTTGEPGGARTGQRVTHYVIENGPFDVAFREMPADWVLPFTPCPLPAPKPRESTQVAYDCPRCGITVSGKPGFRIECIDCGAQMVASSKAAPSSGVGT